ncbi:RNA 2',3'-cyclic phosphodiesterase [Andreprevotia sp. IGB-42]|uniref:RNA 2',3'-cyclic phosphodiesterase n=1 Tax=Andreprevotia sp. IGB-42 TaxID=2497473 RepID=UPI00135B4704|nr:RNA 2',3'-cyclic phosphodiesterase [Andreprevotia sp. IGB-42]KAF0815425.1 RNA 2',3'-cyclic phosphodiesterase [Andreprevotia sp. IGB-42]
MRLFIGLAPPADARAAIARERDRLHAQTGGRPSSDANLHLTLAFIGASTPQALQRIRKMLETMPAVPFALTLDCAGDFRRGGIVWLGSSTPAAALLALADAVRAGLAAADVPFDPQPFAPHVTLLRKGQPVREQLAAPISWLVDTLVLYVSESTEAGVQYRPLYQRLLAAR